MLDNKLWLFEGQIWTLAFYNARTVRSGNIWLLHDMYIGLDILSAIDLTKSNTTENDVVLQGKFQN